MLSRISKGFAKSFLCRTKKRICSSNWLITERVMPAAPISSSAYQKIVSKLCEDTIPIEIYKSSVTGIRVAICQVPGPIVNGYFMLATEAHDDDGLPHTLEHLVFMGSEDYPYKGVLDMLANRCFAQGTNAYTDVDHTVYTVETAGAEGFLNFLPVYIEHVLYPTLTDSAFATEVHHITETGEDGGVVYCEMQGCENTGENRTYLELMREIYPGKCGFKSETGGIMKNLRESTTNVKVKNYHAQFYRPDNLTLIITGQVDPQDVFKTMSAMDEKIKNKLEKNLLPKMERPWMSPVPELTKSVTKVVPFGNDTEDKGMVLIGFRGPKAIEIYKSLCFNLVLDYFSDTSVAPLRQAFVENENPFCSNVKWSMMEATESTIFFKFANVESKNLDKIRPKFFEVIKAELDKGLKMERLKAIIEKKRLETLNSLEDCPHEATSGEVMGHILFGLKEQELEDRLNKTKQLAKAAKESEKYWKELMTELTTKPYVEIIGKPSLKEKAKLAKEVEDLVAKRKAELGESGLAQMEKDLEDAVDQNEIEAPDEMLSKIPIPDVEKIHFHNLTASSNYRKTDEATKVDLKLFPFITELDDIQETQFIAWTMLFDTSGIGDELKPYLMLWTELIGETAVKDEKGAVIKYEDVVAGLERDLLESSCQLGAVNGATFSAGSFPEMLSLSMKVDRDSKLQKYSDGVSWLSRLLFRQNFEADRVKSIIQKVLNTVDGKKRNGRTVCSATHMKLIMTANSNPYHASVLNQEKILKSCLKIIDKEPAKLLGYLYKITEYVTQLNRMRLHLTTAVQKFPSPDRVTSPWNEVFLKSWTETRPSGSGDIRSDYGAFKVVRSKQLMKKMEDIKVKSAIVAVGAVESSYLVQSHFVNIDSYEHEDIAPVMVLIEYLTGLEGPMWRLIRGLGYSYGYSVHLSVETGSLNLHLMKSTNLPKAYEKAIEIIQGYLNGSEEFEEMSLEASRSSVMFEVIEREKSIGDASVESMMNHLRAVDKHYNKQLLKKVSEVSLKDLSRVCQKYFATFFDQKASCCAISCHPSKVDEICAAFAKMPEGCCRDLTKFKSFDQVFDQ